jgi:hypothetical protein
MVPLRKGVVEENSLMMTGLRLRSIRKPELIGDVDETG